MLSQVLNLIANLCQFFYKLVHLCAYLFLRSFSLNFDIWCLADYARQANRLVPRGATSMERLEWDSATLKQVIELCTWMIITRTIQRLVFDRSGHLSRWTTMMHSQSKRHELWKICTSCPKAMNFGFRLKNSMLTSSTTLLAWFLLFNSTFQSWVWILSCSSCLPFHPLLLLFVILSPFPKSAVNQTQSVCLPACLLILYIHVSICSSISVCVLPVEETEQSSVNKDGRESEEGLDYFQRTHASLL